VRLRVDIRARMSIIRAPPRQRRQKRCSP
jgi:hypothetical protein